MCDRYEMRDGHIWDNVSCTIIPFDLYWVVDLLNLKESNIRELEEVLE